MPTVSVIIPTYRHQAFIIECLNSVFAQTFKDFELIVVNDGSPDQTEIILQPLIAAGRIQYIAQKNWGTAAARNRGLSIAKGEFVAFLDDDDVWPPDKLEWQLDSMMEGGPIAVVGARQNFTDQIDQPTTNPASPERTLRFEDFFDRNPIGSPGQVLMRRSTLTALGGFDETIWGADDLDLWLRLSRLGEIKFPKRLALRYRVHSGNASRDRLTMMRNVERVLQKHLTSNDNLKHRMLSKKANRYLFRSAGKDIIRQMVAQYRNGKVVEANQLSSVFYRHFSKKIFQDPKLLISVCTTFVDALARSRNPEILSHN